MTWRFLSLLLFACLQSDVARGDGPFVAGFERFGRHSDIDQVASGRLLLRELSCTSCHLSEEVTMSNEGPLLDGVAARLNLAWVERFIAQPHSVKPGTTMPDVLGQRSATERAAQARSLTAFLSTQNRPPTEVKGSGLLPVPHQFWNKGDRVRGKLLYHQIGCVACHKAGKDLAVAATSSIDQLMQDLDAEEIAKLGLSAVARAVPSVPLGDLKAKYTVAGLTHFLLDPMQFRPAGRMPALKLSPVESADVASYLLEHPAAPPRAIAVDEAEIARGRELFVELNCVQCHAAGDLRPRPNAKPLRQLDLSSDNQCLDATTAVNYHLDDAQVGALRSALHAEKQAEKWVAMEQLELQLLAFNCYACHERDRRGGVARFRRDHFETVAQVDLGDEGRLPPPLTGVGRKLQPAWFKNVLLGKQADVRPHMQIRMPIFHMGLASQLPQLFWDVDQSNGEKFTFSDQTESIEVGRQLMDVGCVQCHTFEGSSLPGVMGVDLRSVSLRLQPNWFQEFLLNPSAVKARTRMPAFFPDGKSQRPDLLDGDINRQIAAMWAYLNTKSDVELPDRIQEARARNYELRPKDEPIVLRTFMKDVGTHAIAVGFPQQIHYAFDAENVRLAIGWRGKFLDAQGTWFVRFAPPAEPLGEAIAKFANAVPIAKLTEVSQAWPSNADDYHFSGYRLDEFRVPTILYRLGDIEVEDRIAPIDAATLGRTLKMRKDTSGSARIWFIAAADKKLTRISDQTYTNQAGLRTTLVDRTGKLRTTRLPTSGERDEWLVPIEFEKAFELELQYQW